VEVGESTLKKLIEGEKQFQVPLYQRQYSWKEEELGQLWDDVLEQYDLLTPDEGGRIDEDVPAHFLGSMVLAPARNIHADGVAAFTIIDGQQRLTTLLIAICAIRDVAAEADPTAMEKFNELYLINKFAEDGSYYRLVPTQVDREAFFTCIDPVRRARGNDIVSRAYSFFRAKLALPGPDGQPLDIQRLETVLRERLQFVAITCGQHDNVHRIFESLNDRGVGLTQADLLRNYIFMLLPTKGERVYGDVWTPMQEHLTPAELETLVFVDLVIRGNSTVKRPDIYRAQQDRLRPKENDEAAVEAEVLELARRARLFKRILDPTGEEDDGLRKGLLRLKTWAAGTTFPILLHLFDLRDRGECTEDEMAQAIDYVEGFLVRRMISGVPTNNLNRILNALPSSLDRNLPVAEAIRQDLSGPRKFWPSDRTLREAIRSKPFYFQGRGQQKMVVFRRLEESYGHEEPVDWEAASLTIEHVMPQSLSDEWREALEAENEDPDVVHEELLHTMGNLTVTAYNGELSNHPFERKKQILKGSNLELNKYISPRESWGRTEILRRAEELADQALAIWPGPLPGQEREEQYAGKDWSRLHAALAAMPAGSWTSYSDCAELIASHHVPVGQHMANTPGLLNGHRVLSSSGRVAEGFRWLDPEDDRDVREVLRAEGVRFDDKGRAAPSQRFRADDLAGLIGEIVETPAEEDREHGWRRRRWLQYIRHFYLSPGGRLHEDESKTLAVREGYDPRGVAGFYQGENAALMKDGHDRVLTEAGREYFEEHRHLID
jgi:alkylated DNA nucleotide flippase Atl1